MPPNPKLNSAGRGGTGVDKDPHIQAFTPSVRHLLRFFSLFFFLYIHSSSGQWLWRVYVKIHVCFHPRNCVRPHTWHKPAATLTLSIAVWGNRCLCAAGCRCCRLGGDQPSTVWTAKINATKGVCDDWKMGAASRRHSDGRVRDHHLHRLLSHSSSRSLPCICPLCVPFRHRLCLSIT